MTCSETACQPSNVTPDVAMRYRQAGIRGMTRGRDSLVSSGGGGGGLGTLSYTCQAVTPRWINHEGTVESSTRWSPDQANNT